MFCSWAIAHFKKGVPKLVARRDKNACAKYAAAFRSLEFAQHVRYVGSRISHEFAFWFVKSAADLICGFIVILNSMTFCGVPKLLPWSLRVCKKLRDDRQASSCKPRLNA